MKKYVLTTIFIVFFYNQTWAQWMNPVQVNPLNNWSGQAGFMGYWGNNTNAPNSDLFGSGIQTQMPGDTRFGAQMVFPAFEYDIYYRTYQPGVWSNWFKVWSTANFDPTTFLGRTTPKISTAGQADAFTNGYTFSYKIAGTPWNGSLISFGGFTSNYDTQINTDYGPDGGGHMSFRTKMGDANTWNSWFELYHSGNLNRSDADFTARTLTATNIYNNGNLWSKQIKVALTNPFPDYVFKKDYRLPTLVAVKSYIDRNQHLPEFPSADQVAKDGIDVAEMNSLLVKKIEELTLYLIEKDKELKEQQEAIKKLTQRVQALEEK
jgi:hypothetical protein